MPTLRDQLMRDQLIKLGSKNPALREHIRPVLAGLEKEASDTFTIRGRSLYDLYISAGAVYAAHIGKLLSETLRSNYGKDTVVETKEAFTTVKARLEDWEIVIHPDTKELVVRFYYDGMSDGRFFHNMLDSTPNIVKAIVDEMEVVYL